MASATQSSAGHAAGVPPFSANDSRRAGAGAEFATWVPCEARVGRFRRAVRLTRGGTASGGDDWAWAKILANPRDGAGHSSPQKRNGGGTGDPAASRRRRE